MGAGIPASEPLRIEGPEQGVVNVDLPDGALPPAIGVHNFQVFRATRGRPELADGKGYTYNHHVDMGCWKGLLYVGWNSCEKDEDTWPSRELYSTSPDGAHWSDPAELFPQGVSMPLRMYFFHAPNRRMLAIAGLRVTRGLIGEKLKGPLVVREIRSDHTLGEFFTLRPSAQATAESPPPLYTEAKENGFVEACNQLLANRPFLEQQDYGLLLDDRRMKWHDAGNWPDRKLPHEGHEFWVFGKGMSFFHRKDGALVGIAKRGWVTVSTDEGETWSQPAVPSTFVVGSAKTWPQRTSDGRYALVFNPDKHKRLPLVIVTGQDGVTFRDMRVVQGEVPIMRYEGGKGTGPQYVRGISEWSGDGSWKDQAMWIVYSMNKEDVWVGRIPVPVRAAASVTPVGDFDATPAGPIVPGWNVYSPKWAPVSVVRLPGGGSKCLRLEDRDPYDYARAVCVFPQARKLAVSFEVMVRRANRGTLGIELLGESSRIRPVRVALTDDNKLEAVNGGQTVELPSHSADRWLAVKIEANAVAGKFSLSVDGKCLLKDAAFADGADSLHQVSFRTGEYRQIGGVKAVQPETDCPVEPAIYDIRNVRITP